MVVATSCLPEPFLSWAYSSLAGRSSGPERSTRAGTGPPGRGALQQVLVQVGVVGRPVVGRVALLQGLVGHVDAEAVPEGVEGAADELLHLVGGVAGLELPAQPAALDGLGEDHRRLALVVEGGPVGGMHLAQVVAAAVDGQGDHLGVGQPSISRAAPWCRTGARGL
jgi:hypothetical protein